MAFLAGGLATLLFGAEPRKAPTPPPEGVQEITVVNSLDGVAEPVWFLPNPSAEPAPLLVHLHSWSARLGAASLARDCAKRGWAFLSPNFRGPNNRPDACASPVAIRDIVDAVAYAQKHTRVDPRRIYLVGGSGGGHMTLMMAHAEPKLWSAVSAWVPITDLADWHAFSQKQGSNYHKMLEQACGGPPSPATAAEYRSRSPLFHLDRAAGLRIDIQVGLRDGHQGSVPVSNSLRAFNRLAAANGKAGQAFSAEEIGFITREAKIPEYLRSEPATETSRTRAVLFRRTAGPVRLTIFDGAHETDFSTAVRWLAEQGSRP
jgi:pimeloyl-ACP methyl ester carboxylesterase